MAGKTKIEWTNGGATWNPITGCSVVSPGCTNCYAMHLAGTRLKHHPSRAGLTDMTKTGPVWNGQVRFNQSWLDQPLRWRKPRMIFVCAHGDLFHEDVPDAWIDRVFAVMALAPQHTFQCLTKRAGRMAMYMHGNPLPRVSALIYNAMHEQGTSATFQRAVRDRFKWSDLAGGEAPRSGGEAGRGLRNRRSHQSLQMGKGGIPTEAGLSAGDGNNRRAEDRDRGASAGLASCKRSDSQGADDQPQERDKDRQSAGKFGVGHDGRATSSRSGSAERQSQSPAGEQAPQNEIDRGRCSGDPGTPRRGLDGQGYRGSLRHEGSSNLCDLLPEDLEARIDWPLPNVWLGISAEDQTRADERIPDLLATPAAVRWVSAEPLLGPIDFDAILFDHARALPRLDWIVVGGESAQNKGARPMDPDWARSIRDQCAAAGVPFFMKQMANKAPIPEDLMVRQWPT